MPFLRNKDEEDLQDGLDNNLTERDVISRILRRHYDDSEEIEDTVRLMARRVINGWETPERAARRIQQEVDYIADRKRASH